MPDERIDVATASRALGITRDAVRARCQRQSLDARKDADGRWRIHLPEGTRPEGAPSAHDVTAELITSLRAHIATLEHENARLAFELDDARDAMAWHRKALTDAAIAVSKRPWWRRLLGRPPDSA